MGITCTGIYFSYKSFKSGVPRGVALLQAHVIEEFSWAFLYKNSSFYDLDILLVCEMVKPENGMSSSLFSAMLTGFDLRLAGEC